MRISRLKSSKAPARKNIIEMTTAAHKIAMENDNIISIFLRDSSKENARNFSSNCASAKFSQRSKSTFVASLCIIANSYALSVVASFAVRTCAYIANYMSDTRKPVKLTFSKWPILTLLTLLIHRLMSDLLPIGLSYLHRRLQC